MKLGFQCVTAHSNPGFIYVLASPRGWIVMLLTPLWPESGFLARGISVAAAG
jgi:hypothetical protein